MRSDKGEMRQWGHNTQHLTSSADWRGSMTLRGGDERSSHASGKSHGKNKKHDRTPVELSKRMMALVEDITRDMEASRK